MKKSLLLFVFLFCSIAAFNAVVFSQAPQKNQLVVEGIVVEKKVFEAVPCPGSVEGYAKGITRVTAVETKTTIKEPLEYEYSISGGRVIGNGRKIKWDLSNVRLGRYTINVRVKNDKDFDKTFTTGVFVEGCYSVDCLGCPDIKIQGPAKSFKSGDVITFTAKIANAFEETYRWKVSGGRIIKGQGTPVITVKVQKSTGNRVMVELKTTACPYCPEETMRAALSVDYKK